MSQNNNPSIIYAGLDIAKASLALHLAGVDYALANTTAGRKKLLALVGKLANTHVVCEASGGYERSVALALSGAQIPVSILNPRQVYHFAKSLNRRVKTDPLDAQLLSLYGERCKPAPTRLRSACERELCEAIRYRRQLLEKLLAERQALDGLEFAPLKREARSLVRQMETKLEKIEKLILQMSKEDQALKAKSQRLTSIKGVGELSALSLLAELPELGTLKSKQLCALAGLAPHARESGSKKSKRHIGGGRDAVRKSLYMAALSAARYHASLSLFYQRLRKAGKPFKVAITAVMRKLLILLNLALKFPNLALAN